MPAGEAANHVMPGVVRPGRDGRRDRDRLAARHGVLGIEALREERAVAHEQQVPRRVDAARPARRNLPPLVGRVERRDVEPGDLLVASDQEQEPRPSGRNCGM